MANGMTRLALSKLQIQGKQQDESAGLKNIVDNQKKGKKLKIALKNPSEHNHSN